VCHAGPPSAGGPPDPGVPVAPEVIWCSSNLAGTAQNASTCAAKALQPIVASVNTERRSGEDLLVR